MQRIRAFGAQRLAEAQAAAIAARQTAEADYTDVRAREAREQVERPKELTENLNKGNLFYSSEFGKQQSSLARALTESAAQSQRAHQERLGGITSSLAGVERDAAEQEAEAREAAAERLRERLGDLDVGGPAPGGGPGRPGTSRPAPPWPTAKALARVVRNSRPRSPVHRGRPAP